MYKVELTTLSKSLLKRVQATNTYAITFHIYKDDA